jgi:pilus assembly protein CpaC
VRPRVSEIDNTTGTSLNGVTVPGLKVREIDTGVEMRAGQTLAIAGLVNYREETTTQGLPFFSELPYIGMFFGNKKAVMNEVELLIMVTPHWIEAMDPEQVPFCGPGQDTTFPTDFQLFVKQHVEVPKLVSPNGASFDAPGGMPVGPMPAAEEVQPTNPVAPPPPAAAPQNDTTGKAGLNGLVRPAALTDAKAIKTRPAGASPTAPVAPGPSAQLAARPPVVQSAPLPTSVRVTTPMSQPQPAGGIARNNPDNRQAPRPGANGVRPAARQNPGLIGPIGYDDLK